MKKTFIILTALALLVSSCGNKKQNEQQTQIAIRLADESVLKQFDSYHDWGTSDEFHSDVIIADVAVKSFRKYNTWEGKLSSGYIDLDEFTPEKPIAIAREYMWNTVFSYLDNKNERRFFAFKFDSDELKPYFEEIFNPQYEDEFQGDAEEMPTEIDYNQLQKKGGIYYLNNEPFTGTAKKVAGEEGGQQEIETWEMKDGKFHGEYINSGPGFGVTGTYKDGKKHGEFKYIVYEGEGEEVVMKIETYENGKLIKTWENKTSETPADN
jgi:hypothetical protein